MRQFVRDAHLPLLWWLFTVVVGGAVTALGLRDLGPAVVGVYIIAVTAAALAALVKTWAVAAQRADSLSERLDQAQALTADERDAVLDAMERASDVYSLLWAYSVSAGAQTDVLPPEWPATIREHCLTLGKYSRTMARHDTIVLPLWAIATQAELLLGLIEAGWFAGGFTGPNFGYLQHLTDIIRWSRDGVIVYGNRLLGRTSDRFSLPLVPPTPLP